MHKESITQGARRRFLTTTAAGMAGWAVGQNPQASAADPRTVQPEIGTVSQLAEHLSVYQGPINVGILRDGDKALLIDCGDASVAGVLSDLGITSIDRVLFTHHHRDQACGAAELVAAGARLSVPAAEKEYFDNVEAYWADPKSRWHIYNQHPHHLMLAESVPVDATLNDGEQLSWGPAKIRVISTPGHTDASISYLVEVDGERIVFCGDAIYDEGRIWDLYSLQKGITTTDYHGFLGARDELIEGLGRIKALKPDRLVSSHGGVTDKPAAAIDELVERLEQCYDKYVAISALRHYFPNMFTEYVGRKDHMAIRPGKAVPDCLRHFGTTWVLIAKDKSALVMDCGSPAVIDEIKKLLQSDEIRSVEGLWVTHYHDDHVDAIPKFQQTFDCPCITDRHVAEVIANPTAWRLPCISPSRARIDRVTEDGQSWPWHEFQLTAYFFPGQTYYHAGLLVERDDLRMFFAGDSFTMGGIDDYCAHNRNWLGQGAGFDRCLALLEKLRPTHIFNCHVDVPFDFTPEQIRFMRQNLADREKLFGQLFPWDHANYGMDEPWVRCFPYEQRAKPGETIELKVVVTNHCDSSRQTACRAVLPKSLGGTSGEWTRTVIPAKQDGELSLSIQIPADARPGRHVIPIDLQDVTRSLPQFTEAIVVL